jgi:hypothetical protein
MKRPIIYLAVTLGILAGLAGCTTHDNEDIAKSNPALAPTTRAVEAIEKKVDKIASGVQTVGSQMQTVADAGKAAGLPYTDWLKMAGGAAILVGGLWMGLRGRGSSSSSTTTTTGGAP